MRWLVAVIILLAIPSVAEAQVELKNDGFATGGQIAAHDGFATGEIGASRFIAPETGRTLQQIRFVFAGATTTHGVTIKVWDDSGGGDVPGTELFTGDFQITGNDSAFQQTDVSASNIILPVQFRVGVQLQHAGLPSLTSDADGTNTAGRNFLLANVAGTFRWFQSSAFAVTGDWIIRAEISSVGGPATDAGVTIDGPEGTGGACIGNAQCPTGQYCDLASRTCTLDCRTGDDCGGSTCNSLGQCVGFNGDGGGCGCRGSRDGSGLVLWLGLVVLGLVARRR